MKVYRVKKNTHTDSSHGFSFHSSKKEAVKELSQFKKGVGDNWLDLSEDGGIDVLEIEISAKGIIRALNRYADHPDNG